MAGDAHPFERQPGRLRSGLGSEVDAWAEKKDRRKKISGQWNQWNQWDRRIRTRALGGNGGWLHVQLESDRFKEFSLQARILQCSQISLQSALVKGTRLVAQSDRVCA